MKSIMAHNFSQVPKVAVPRSQFNRSHGHKTTLDEAGKLYPIYVDEYLPGDTVSLNMTAFARMATPIAPLMDNLFMDIHFFACDNRLLWENWKKFNGEQTNPGDSTDFTVPIVTAPGGGYAEGSLFDYMGIPTKVASIEINALHSRMYNFVFNEWYRDENLIDSVVVDTDNGPDTDTDYTILNRGKRHDYFTSALPWPQKGTEVSIPLGTEAPVTGLGKLNQTYPNAPGTVYETGASASTSYASAVDIDGGSASQQVYVEEDPNNAGYPNIRADLSNATAASINTLRQAFQVQKMYERDARGGTRYIELVASHFGVTSPDTRMQRPEYLGGGTFPINIHPITQTSETGTTPQGTMAGFATASGRAGFTKSFTEHGCLLGICSIRADLTYQQGLNRMWSRQTRLDYYWPSLAHIGEQPIYNKEIYAQGTSVDEDVFGYQERYAEYRYFPSLITGAMRSNHTGSLDLWHLSQEFGSLPLLDDTFIAENPPMARILAVPSEPAFIFDSYFDIKAARPMPVYGVPGLIDHF